VPGTGQYPAYRDGLLRKNTTGPLARRAADLMPLLRILSGPDGRDTGCRAIALGDPAAVDLSSLRVWVVEGDATRVRVDGELRAAQQNAAYALARRGSRVEMRQLAELRRSQAIAGAMLLEAGDLALESALGDGEPIGLAREWLRLALRRSDHTYPPLVAATEARIGRRARFWVKRHADLGRALAARLADWLGDDGVMLYPSARGPAPHHGLRAGAHFRYTGIFNALELPVTQVPLGLGSAKLPLGVQVVAAHGRDHLSIAVALALEKAFGGWVSPGDLEDPARLARA
jgi:fatty acid amide hydrolase 2